VVFAVAYFEGSENSLEEGDAKPGDGGFDAVDFRDINSHSNDHGA